MIYGGPTPFDPIEQADASTCCSRFANAVNDDARLLSPYREHLAKHFADTFSRIGLPVPY